jgi:radical SAM protein with 4Fe4S-binding SPASM domain
MDQPRHIDTLDQEALWEQLYRKAGEQRVPVYAMIELTYGCNLRCVHCYNPTHVAQGELPTQKVRDIIDRLAEQGCVHLAFSGGELLTRRDALEIVAYARGGGFTVSLLTNATMITPDAADRIQALHPKAVEISMYGATQETYERVTRIPGSFPLFLRGVGLLRERKIPLVIKMPVMTLNQHEIRQAKVMVEGWGVKFVYCCEIFPRVDGSLEPLQYRIAPQDVTCLDRAFGQLGWRAEGGGQPEGVCRRREGLFTCTCGKSSVAITPYGEMNLCVSFPVPKYDLRTGSVADGWQSLTRLIDEANANPGEAYECPNCELDGVCRQGPMNAWLETGRLEPCLPYFKELAKLEHAYLVPKPSRSASKISTQGSGTEPEASDETGDDR